MALDTETNPSTVPGRRKAYTFDEVAAHNHLSSLWIIIRGRVYDVSSFAQRHPGGAAVLVQRAGEDATDAFVNAHRGSTLPSRIMKDFCIGVVTAGDTTSQASPETLSTGGNSSGGNSALASVHLASELLSENGEGLLSGEDALTTTADLVYQSMCYDTRLDHIMKEESIIELAVGLRYFLEFLMADGQKEQPWPMMSVGPEWIEELSGTIGSAILRAVELAPRPRRPGEDAVGWALDTLRGEMHSDMLVTRCTTLLRSAIVADWEDSAAHMQQRGQTGEEIDSNNGPAKDAAEFDLVASEVEMAVREGINLQSFEELSFGAARTREVQAAWSAFLTRSGSQEVAGEAVYSALFDSAPSLQGLFKTARAVMAIRFMLGLSSIVAALSTPHELKSVIETLAFQHLDLEVTVARIVVFRDAFLGLLAGELGELLTENASEGFRQAMNYAGGAFIYARVRYADRLKTLATSWAIANGRGAKEFQGEASGEINDEVSSQGDELPDSAKLASESQGPAAGGSTRRWFNARWARKPGDAAGANVSEVHARAEGGNKNSNVPTTFNDMFRFNLAVMGFSASKWMSDVLDSFDNIVVNVASSTRMKEECDVLSLRLAKFKGNIYLPQFKQVMLASLRSLVPKDWGQDHEVAWNWLWDMISRMLKAWMGKPALYQQALSFFVGSLDELRCSHLRRDVYIKFFALAPRGQDFFKQSTTRLHFIADRVIEMSLDMYARPVEMVEEISLLGLRHVGYGIPVEFFGPFVTGCIQAVRDLLKGQPGAEDVEDAFRWSLNLVSRILVRAITEGSTLVMKAINVNSARAVRKAASSAPRGRRGDWMLRVQVGTQSISPLMCALEAGSLEASGAIIEDLLSIRADRERYYFGMDEMFERHPDILERLLMMAPTLVPVLLDGLVWRSRIAEKGSRRVNFYVKHLVQDAHGEFSKTCRWLAKAQNPSLACHRLVVFLSNSVWRGVVFRAFLLQKSWFVITLAVFILSQSILAGAGAAALGSQSDAQPAWWRLALVICRLFTYVCSFAPHLIHHVYKSVIAFRTQAVKRFGRFLVPAYLVDEWREALSALLALALGSMFAFEPLLHCLPQLGEAGGIEDRRFLSTQCEMDVSLRAAYSVSSSVAMVLFFLMALELVVVSTHLSAYLLVCVHVLPEVGLFLLGLAYSVAVGSCAARALEQSHADFANLAQGAKTMFSMAMGMYSEEGWTELEEHPAVLAVTIGFIVCSVIFFANLLVAQLNASYASVYEDMVGFARLDRLELIVSTMPAVSPRRWASYLNKLRLDQRIEFNEGDVGLAGGVQVLEPASRNPTTVDSIRRYGGSTSPDAPWPEDSKSADNVEDRFDRIENLIEKALRRACEHADRSLSSSGRRPSSDGSSAGRNPSNGA